jgi:hypothetical protein
MSISMQFDDSKLNTKPGDVMADIGKARSTLSGKAAAAGSVKRMMKGAIKDNSDRTAEAKRQDARDADIAHTTRKETVKAAIRHGSKIAATESNNKLNVSAFAAKESAKQGTIRTAASAKVRVAKATAGARERIETAKQGTKSTPAAKAAPAPKATVSKPRAPRKPASPLIHTDAKGKVTGYTHRSSATLPKTTANSSAPKPTTAAKPRKV